MKRLFSMTFASSLTNVQELNSSFDKASLRICYAGQNRNGSSISEDAITNALPSIYNCPIVCNYDRKNDAIGGHDMAIVTEDDGSMRLINLTQPIGVIPESANTWYEDFEEADGTTHSYLCTDALLWKRQEAYKKIHDDGVESQSMEITILDGNKDENGVYCIDNFEFKAFCLLGNVAPCFESAALEMYSQDEFANLMSEMMQDYKNTFAANPNLLDGCANQDDLTKGGNEASMDEKMKLAEKYGIDTSTLDFSLGDLSLEDLEAKFQAMNDVQDDPQTEVENFELASNIKEEAEHALSSQKMTNRWGEEYIRYGYVDIDTDKQEIYCWDHMDWLLYGIPYQMSGDSMVLDFDNAARKKYQIVDFDEGEQPDSQPSPFAPVFALAEQKFQEMESAENSEKDSEEEEKFSEGTDAQEEAAPTDDFSQELEELRTFKANVDEQVVGIEAAEVFAKFEDLNGIDAFESLKAQFSISDNEEKFALENLLSDDYKNKLKTLQRDCYAIRGENMAVTQFSLNKRTPKQKVDRTVLSKDSDEPYGGIFLEYGHGDSN